ncbi:unnamed protein product [Amoebophrya sp. A120]|nr:unnamed protein product [Amoebophrya sp. A120]|eukprot:GSA120T00008783001.1
MEREGPRGPRRNNDNYRNQRERDGDRRDRRSHDRPTNPLLQLEDIHFQESRDTTNNNTSADTIHPWKFDETSSLPILRQITRLPIQEKKKEFLLAVEENDVVLLIGSTGCGKSTQLPQFLLDAGYNTSTTGSTSSSSKSFSSTNDSLKFPSIAVTVSRRLAALQLAERVGAEREAISEHEYGASRGRNNCDKSQLDQKSFFESDSVAYKVRNETAFTWRNPKGTSVETEINESNLSPGIVFLLDEILLQELVHDPLLLNYSVIILDDAHERTVAQDLLLGMLVKIKKVRKNDLKIIITSATLDVTEFVGYLEKWNEGIRISQELVKDQMLQEMELVSEEEGDDERNQAQGSPRAGAATSSSSSAPIRKRRKVKASNKVSGFDVGSGNLEELEDAKRKEKLHEELQKGTGLHAAKQEGTSAAASTALQPLSYTVLSCEGTSFPVRVKYLEEPCGNYLEKIVEVCNEILFPSSTDDNTGAAAGKKTKDGDILCFVTGADEVHVCLQLLKEEFSEYVLTKEDLYEEEIAREERERNRDHHGRRRRSDSREGNRRGGGDPLRSNLHEKKFLRVCGLYAGMSFDEQLEAFAVHNEESGYSSATKIRKIIVSTNLAETAVTIPGIRFVIDCCFVKLPCFFPPTMRQMFTTGGTNIPITYKTIIPCAQSNCDQRAGRGGRVEGGGYCYRLCTKEEFLEQRGIAKTDVDGAGIMENPKNPDGLENESALSTNQKIPPAILREDFTSSLLRLKSFGIDQVCQTQQAQQKQLEQRNMTGSINQQHSNQNSFPFLTPPTKEGLVYALQTLHKLNFLDANARLTQPWGILAAQVFAIVPNLHLVKFLFAVIEAEFWSADRICRFTIEGQKMNADGSTAEEPDGKYDKHGFLKNPDDANAEDEENNDQQGLDFLTTDDKKKKQKKNRENPRVKKEEFEKKKQALLNSTTTPKKELDRILTESDNLLPHCLTILAMVLHQATSTSNSVFQESHKSKARLLACKQSLGVKEGDLISLLNVYYQWEDEHGGENTSSGNQKNKDSTEFCNKYLLKKQVLMQIARLRRQLTSFVVTKLLPELLFADIKLFPDKHAKVKYSDMLRKLSVSDNVTLAKQLPLLSPEKRQLEELQKCVAKSMFMNCCVKTQEGNYSSVFSAGNASKIGGSRTAFTKFKIDQQSFLFDPANGISTYPNCVVFLSCNTTSAGSGQGGGQLEHFIQHVTAIDPNWLSEIAPTVFEDSNARAREGIFGTRMRDDVGGGMED